MGPLLQQLIKEHKGKTVTLSTTTLFAILWGLSEMGVEIPVPATRGYVDQAIMTGTKGLDYLVKQAIEADVDVAAYEVNCMNETWKGSQLQRLKDQYRDLVGEPYVEKSCEELAQRVQRLAGQAR